MAAYANLPAYVMTLLRENVPHVFDEAFGGPSSPHRFLDVLELYSGSTRIAGLAAEAGSFSKKTESPSVCVSNTFKFPWYSSLIRRV